MPPKPREPRQTREAGAEAGKRYRRTVGDHDQVLADRGIEAMAKTLHGQMDGLKFELDNARKDLRYYTNMTEQLPVTSFLAETAHQITVMADNLGYGERFIPRLIDVLMQVAAIWENQIGNKTDRNQHREIQRNVRDNFQTSAICSCRPCRARRPAGQRFGQPGLVSGRRRRRQLHARPDAGTGAAVGAP